MADRRTKAQLLAALADAEARIATLEANVVDLFAELDADAGQIERAINAGLRALELDGVFDPARAAIARNLAELLDTMRLEYRTGSDSTTVVMPSGAAPIAKQLAAVLTELTPPTAATPANPLAEVFRLTG